MPSPTHEGAIETADERLSDGDAAAARGDVAQARHLYELALDGVRDLEGKDTPGANAKLRRSDAHRRLGDLAEHTEAREEAREHYLEALNLAAELLERDLEVLRPRIAYLLMQIARLDALAGKPSAEDTFRDALRLGGNSVKGEQRSTIWHYVGAYCSRRELPIAAFLAHQQSLDELPDDTDTSRLLDQVRQQLFTLQDLGEVLPMLGLWRLLERHGALSGVTVTTPPTAEAIGGQLGIDPAAATELLALLDKPANLVKLRDDVVARMHSAVPDFHRQFVDGELNLEDTRGCVLPPPEDG